MVILRIRSLDDEPVAARRQVSHLDDHAAGNHRISFLDKLLRGSQPCADDVDALIDCAKKILGT
jgi:hypothetical protein